MLLEHAPLLALEQLPPLVLRSLHLGLQVVELVLKDEVTLCL
jgi:hypothetical protein